MKILTICNPSNRRFLMFKESLVKFNLDTDFISYLDILNSNFDKLKNIIHKYSLIRIESPGENIDVEEKIIQLYSPNSFISRQRGAINYPNYWYNGFKILLNEINTICKQDNINYFNTPSDIKIMFNKPLCQQKLKEYNINVPINILKILSYNDFKTSISQKNMYRCFIKLNYSSSASGICAYQYNPKLNKEILTSTIEMVMTKDSIAFYNSLRIRTYTNKNEIKIILDWLFNEGAIVEEWIPKSDYSGYYYDLRVLLINSKPRHIIPRLSKSPFTNLHLGNKRGDINLINIPNLNEVLDEVTKVSKVFSNSLYQGVDVLIKANSFKPYIIDVNAFGDLIPNILYNNMTTYEYEIFEVVNEKFS